MSKISVEWLNIFQGTPQQLVQDLSCEKAESYKLMAVFLLENRVLSIRETLPPLLTAALAIKDNRFTKNLLKEANFLDVAQTIKMLRQNAAGIGLNKRTKAIFREWLQNLPGDVVELEILAYPQESRYIVDMLHTHPKIFGSNWLQTYIFGGYAPADSIITLYKRLHTIPNGERIDLIRNKPISWAFLLSRVYPKELPDDIAEFVIAKAPFMYLIHYMEKLVQKGETFEHALAKRLISAAEETSFNFGLVLKKYNDLKYRGSDVIKSALLNAAQTLLNQARTPELQEPIFIIGDCSSSMSASMEAAVLMGSVLGQKFGNSCRTLFFNSYVSARKNPRNVGEILKVMKEVRSTGSTAVAAGIAAAVRQGAQTIIIITDGGHNTPNRDFKYCLQDMDVDPSLKGIDLFYIRVRGDNDVVWPHLENRPHNITRMIDLTKMNISYVYGFLKLLLQFFNYDPQLDTWNKIEALKGAFLTESPLPERTGNIKNLAANKLKDTPFMSFSKECLICGEDVNSKSAILLNCGHRYHKKCLTRYWKLLDSERRCVLNCKTPIRVCIECGATLTGLTCTNCNTKYVQL